MDPSTARILRILVVLVIIAWTGIDIISMNPGLVWIYGVLVVLVLVILFWREGIRFKVENK
jgi:hypothetical protein